MLSKFSLYRLLNLNTIINPLYNNSLNSFVLVHLKTINWCRVCATMSGNQSLLGSPLCVKARAILEGLRLANRMEFQVVSVYSASQSLISMLNGLEDGMVEVQSIIWHIEELKKCSQVVNFKYINCNQNGIAHQLARMGLGSSPML